MINYILESSISLTLLLLCYIFLFRNDKLLAFKRFFLPASVVFSLLLPLIEFDIPVSNTANDEPALINNANEIIGYINNVSIEANEQVFEAQKTTTGGYFRLSHLVILLYFTGLGLFLFRFIKNLYQLISKAKGLPHATFHGATIVLANHQTAPYSFFNYIFINHTDYKKMLISNDLLYHELAHVKQYHSIDIVFIELINVLFWFNPVLWFYKKMIRANHEYLADEYALKQTEGTTLNYMEKLINTSFIDTKINLSSGFSHTLIKRRLKMMNKNSKLINSLYKTLLLLPVAGLLVIVLASGQSTTGNTTTYDEEAVSDTFSEKVLELTSEQLEAIGFEERNGNQYFVHIPGSYQYKFVFELKDGIVNTSIYDKTDEKATDRDYYPLLIANPQGEFKYSNYNEGELYRPLLPIANQQFTVYFPFTDDLADKLSDIENLEAYVIRDVQYLEQMLKTKKKSKHLKYKNEWWYPILEKHKIIPSAFSTFPDLLEMGSDNRINNGIVELTDALYVIREKDTYKILKAPIGYHNISENTIWGNNGTLETFSLQSEDAVPIDKQYYEKFEFQLIKENNATVMRNK